jgi:hypothetical protein
MQSDVGACGSHYAGIIVIVIFISPRHGYRHPHRDPRCDAMTMTMTPTLNSLDSVHFLVVILVLFLRTACALPMNSRNFD